MDPDDTAEHTMFSCPRWLDERSRMAEILRRPLNSSDVEEILCGPRPDELPDDSSARSRPLDQARINRQEYINMVESIMSAKETDDQEEQSSAWKVHAASVKDRQVSRSGPPPATHGTNADSAVHRDQQIPEQNTRWRTRSNLVRNRETPEVPPTTSLHHPNRGTTGGNRPYRILDHQNG